MSKRPAETGGSLVFQEGKKIEGDYYIISVYDWPAKNTVSFVAYELETNATYTLPYTYSEIDELFRYNAELMNPTNRDARYHWIIERLDFVVSLDAGSEGRTLCLAPEPTPEEHVQEKKKKTGTTSGRLDAATRAKLCAELDTMDDHGLFVSLVKSEDARAVFLTELHSKRRLEVIKAQQRCIKIDEDREERMKKLEEQRKFIREKAVTYEDNQEKKRIDMAQLQQMMNKQENDKVRKALKKRAQEEQKKQDWRAAKQKERAMEERKKKQEAARELEKNKMLDARRKKTQSEREAVLAEKQAEILKKRQVALDARMKLRQQKKGAKQADLERQEEIKMQLKEEEYAKKLHFEEIERKRQHQDLEREKKRNMAVAEYVRELKYEADAQVRDWQEYKKEVVQDRNNMYAVSAKRKAMEEQKRQENIAWRKRRAEECAQEENQNVAEQKWMEAHREDADPKELGITEEDWAEVEDEEVLRLRLEQEAREKRKVEREKRREQEEAQKASVDSMFSSKKQRDALEGKAANARREEAKRKQLERDQAKADRQNAQRNHVIETQNENMRKATEWARLEKIRNENNGNRENERLAETLAKARGRPVGSCLPVSFIPFY